MYDGEPQLARQRNSLGPPGQHRLGADVDGHPADLSRQQLAADPWAGLEDEYVETGIAREVVGRRQPGDAGSHHYDPRHGSQSGNGAQPARNRHPSSGVPAS